jgi:phytol kinase
VRVSALYFGLVLASGEVVRRWLQVPPDVTRKGVLAALCVWAVAAVSYLSDVRGVAIAFAGLGAALYLSFRFEILAAIEDEGPTLGSVLAPFSLAFLLVVLGSSSPHIAGAAALALIGDGAAALVGRRLGTRKYHVWGHSRTMEGTLALFLVASATTAPALGLLGSLDWHQAVAFALIAATVAASAETISVYGSDNATVPLSAAGTLAALSAAVSQ